METFRTYPLVMLPTDDKQSPLGLQANGVLKFVGSHGLEGLGVGKMQHLYAYSKEEWSTYDKNFAAINADLDTTCIIKDCASQHDSYSWFKVVASTDKNLTPNSWIPDSYIERLEKFYNQYGKPFSFIDLCIISRHINSMSKTGVNRELLTSIDTDFNGSVYVHKKESSFGAHVKKMMPILGLETTFTIEQAEKMMKEAWNAARAGNGGMSFGDYKYDSYEQWEDIRNQRKF